MPLHTTRDDDPNSNTLIRDDPKFAVHKIAFFQYSTVGVFLFLMAGFWDLQIRNPEVYQERALENSVKSVPVLAPRGKILDRDGRVIVDNHSSFSLYLSRENLKLEHLRPIAEGLNLDYDSLVARVRRFQSRRAPQYEPIPIKEELTPGELAFVDAHKDASTFPELEVVRVQHRLYPRDGLAAHVIGYVGEISESELDSPELARFHQGDIIGKDGIEREYNDQLMGVDGQKRVEVDSSGNERHVLDDKEAIPGKNLQLTIDLDLQAVAELTLENRRGAVVALDPRTGEVLAMVSRPAFDPNLFAGRIRSKDWKDLVDNPAHPLLNRAIQAQQAPGSTFKPIMALAALETGAIDDSFHINCFGGATFYGHFYKCWHTHGGIELHRALAQSCDSFFYNVGNRMDIDDIAKYAEMVGYGHKTGIDLPHEADGVVPSRRWKARTLHQKWFQGENISVAIGQGYTTVTPIQMAAAIGGIAVGGMWFQPHLVKDAVHLLPARRAELNLDNIRKVISGMYGVVNEEGGTGVRARLPGLDVCGKTGSAQLVSNAALKAGFRQGQDMKDNAWFVGFAPRDNPEIVVAALFENGEHGQLAAPIARDVIKAYFDKKARLGQSQPQIARVPSNLLQAPPPVTAAAATATLNMPAHRSLRDFDWLMLVLVCAICALGVLQIYSATRDTHAAEAWWKQGVWICAGFVVLWIATLIDYHTLLGQAYVFYGLAVATLVATFAVGMTAFGSRRWIGTPRYHLQVSEFVKLVVVLLVARYLSELKGEQLELRDLLRLLGLVGAPILLVMLQPDLGTALTYLPILAVGVFLAGFRWQYAVAVIVIVAVVAPIGYFVVLKDYQRQRVVTFLDPNQDPKGSGYQVIQSKIAVGSGALWGRGVTKGTQTQGRFLPVSEKDFIFSAFAEEHGFVGVVVALGLYFLLLMQIVQNAQTASDKSGMYICMGVAALLLFHVLVNVGMVVGRMPVTGIPLPLMSSGGSNILAMFLMLGLVNNVRLRRFVN